MHDGGENDGHDRYNDNDENGDLKSYAENGNPLTHPCDLSSCTHDTSLTRQYESEATIALEFVTVKPKSQTRKFAIHMFAILAW